jgi:enoyl-CoA hydratase/carnithine racemase
MAFSDIRYESHDRLAAITLNRPEKLTALTGAMPSVVARQRRPGP